jgi:hypothetical protein
MFDLKAKLSIPPENVVSLLAYAIEKKFGLKIDPSQLEIQYTGDYDTTNFDGYKVEIDLNDVKALQS